MQLSMQTALALRQFGFRLTQTVRILVARGGAEVANGIGSCQGCHQNFAAQFDLICEFVIGSSGLGLTDDVIRNAQAADPRCPH